jgi:hypothetical protein
MYIARGRNVRPYPTEPWGFDNGAYQDHLRGRRLNEDAYRKALDRALRAAETDPPLLFVLPDIVEGGKRSLNYSLDWLERLPNDLPWYLPLRR